MGPSPDVKILETQPCFFMGVCEARNDPLKLGRVKVRIFGIHTDDLSVLSADDLPWAVCLIPTTESGPGGLGTTRPGIPPGTWVFGLFLDGEAKQQPLILGSIQGIVSKPEDSPDNFFASEKRRRQKPLENEDEVFKEEIELGVDITRGFIDPHEEKLSGNPRYSYSSQNEPETHKLARSTELKFTFEDNKQKDRTRNVHKAFDRIAGGEPTPWEEVESARATEYPHLHIHESEAGIITEKDDTPYHERSQTYYGPGMSYEEFGHHHHYSKFLGPDVNIHHAPFHRTYIMGDSDSFVGKDLSKLIGGDSAKEIYGKSSTLVYGDSQIMCFGSKSVVSYGGDLDFFVGNDCNFTVINDYKFQASGDTRLVYRGTLDQVHWMKETVWNEGNLHLLRKRDLYDKVNQKAHYIINDGRYTLISLGDDHLTTSKDYYLHVGADPKTKGDFHQVVKQKKKTRVYDTVSTVYETNEIKQVIKDVDVSIGGDVNSAILGNDRKKVKVDKVLQVVSWFYNKIKNTLHDVGLWWHKINELKQVITTQDSYVKRKNLLSEFYAVHVKGNHSLKVEGDYNLDIAGNMAIIVHGRIVIKTEGIFGLNAGIAVIGADSMSIGSTGAFTIFDPGALGHESSCAQDPNPHTVSEAIEKPEISANIVDLSTLADMTPPECPEFEPIQPEYPDEATLATKPTLPEGDYV